MLTMQLASVAIAMELVSLSATYTTQGQECGTHILMYRNTYTGAIIHICSHRRIHAHMQSYPYIQTLQTRRRAVFISLKLIL